MVTAAQVEVLAPEIRVMDSRLRWFDKEVARGKIVAIEPEALNALVKEINADATLEPD